MATSTQTVPITPAHAGSSLSTILRHGRNEAAKVRTLCLDRLQSVLNGLRSLPVRQSLEQVARGIGRLLQYAQTASQSVVGQILSRQGKQDHSAYVGRASVAPPATFSKRPHNKIGFSFAWVCECGNFSALRSASQSYEGEVERQCPACGETQPLAYVRLLCEPRNDTARAPGKWVYPEVAVESGETGEPVGRDYDWSYYDVIYFQGDRDPDVPSRSLALQS